MPTLTVTFHLGPEDRLTVAETSVEDALRPASRPALTLRQAEPEWFAFAGEPRRQSAYRIRLTEPELIVSEVSSEAEAWELALLFLEGREANDFDLLEQAVELAYRRHLNHYNPQGEN